MVLFSLEDWLQPVKTLSTAQVVNARKEGLASLERARGESAALRNLANAAQLLENNPNLQQLHLYQVLEKKHREHGGPFARSGVGWESGKGQSLRQVGVKHSTKERRS